LPAAARDLARRAQADPTQAAATLLESAKEVRLRAPLESAKEVRLRALLESAKEVRLRALLGPLALAVARVEAKPGPGVEP
jgi:hypothetical protein